MVLRAARQIAARAVASRPHHPSHRMLRNSLTTFSVSARPPSPLPPPPRSSVRKPYVHFERSAPSNRRPSRALLLLTSGCALYVVYYSDVAPFTSRWRVISLSKSAEMELGKAAYQQLLDSVRPSLLHPADARTRRARAVVARLAKACNSLDAQLSHGFKWSVAVSNDATPNAVCVPGGRILVTTGLMHMCSEHELAMVLSHEIAHAVNRHSAEKIQLQMLIWPLFVLLSAIFSSQMLSMSLTKLLLELPFGRKLEREADEVGMIIMTEACYDPRKGPSIFDKLAHATGEHQGGWASKQMKSILSTHPMSERRAADLREKSEQMADRYETKCAVARDMFADAFGFPTS
ncbi:metallopeptidase Oma1 [Gracilaria domingensis]|nr:metallopeptidase Oma1 [Gracilaria domingensis]